MIIAIKDFRDEEYFIPKSVFEELGAVVKTASSKTGEALGSYGGVAMVDLTINNLQVRDFDAIIFIGGSGAVGYAENKECHRIAKDVVETGKVLGAICIAPIILAKAGVLKDRNAVVWSNVMDKSGVKILTEAGARYVPNDVVIDGNIITANGPESARKFAEAIAKTL